MIGVILACPLEAETHADPVAFLLRDLLPVLGEESLAGIQILSKQGRVAFIPQLVGQLGRLDEITIEYGYLTVLAAQGQREIARRTGLPRRSRRDGWTAGGGPGNLQS